MWSSRDGAGTLSRPSSDSVALLETRGRLVLKAVLLHDSRPVAIAWPHSLGLLTGQGTRGQGPLQLILMAGLHIIRGPGALLVVHVGEGLATVVHDLVRLFDELIDLLVHV
jgi:hypothetical protein